MGRVALVTSYPYGVGDPAPLRLLESAGFAVRLSPYQRKHTSAETAALLAEGADVLLAGTEPLPEATIAAGGARLAHIARVGVGLDGLDLAACMRRGIAVTYTPEAPARSVVEEVFGMLFALSRRLVEAHEGLRRGQWNRLVGPLWQGRTLGVLGCGRIGRQVAEIARAFGMRVLAHDLVEDPVWAARHGVRYVGLDELLAASDALSVHLPLTRRTDGLLSRARLAAMKRGAYLINTSRGEIVDEEALADLLQSGHLAGAALDVYREEPYRGPLIALPNVFLCCHQGSCSFEGRLAMELQAAENAVAYARGEPIPRERIVWLPGMAAPAVGWED
ncbi:MAG: phosphoglycerate dehydrogenase [Planctomycetota bacterium]|nr:phosphoglycerate dehydrogenase [Planctomycetota bacterium]MCX8039937.1 phosphoglycerate dehydrogenase [Planctomycetota bacterium]MDW8373690.1 phosphoglycerate dehydrogenase [Planctomycetota bacterium]